LIFLFLFYVFFCLITVALNVLCMHFSAVSGFRVLPLLIDNDDVMVGPTNQNKKLSYHKQIARKLCIQYIKGI